MAKNALDNETSVNPEMLSIALRSVPDWFLKAIFGPDFAQAVTNAADYLETFAGTPEGGKVMPCKFCDEFSGICTNPECPMRAEECPVPDIEWVCKHEKRTDKFLDAIETAYKKGAEAMRRAAIEKIMEFEDGCLGIQKAAFVASRDAIKNLEVPGE